MIEGEGGAAGGATEAQGGGDPAAAAGGAGGAGGATEGQGGGGASSWREALPDDLRGHAALQHFGSVADLAKEHVNQLTLLGRKELVPPKDGDPPEKVDKFYRALGRPDAPEGYDLSKVKVPEGTPWDAKQLEPMRPVFHKAGLTPQQATAIVEGYAGIQAQAWGEWQAQQKQQSDQMVAELRREWGGDFDRRVEGIKRLLGDVMGDRAAALIQLQAADGSPVLDHPLLARFLGELAGSFLEDGGLPTGAAGGRAGTGTPAGARAEIERIRAEAMKDRQHPYVNADHPEHKRINEYVNSLYRTAEKAA